MHLTTFTSLHALFSRLAKTTSSADISRLLANDGKAKDNLEKLLFDASFEGLPEAMRMKRAEAMVEIAKSGGGAGGGEWAWLVEKVRPEVEGSERSVGVRGVLGKVGK